MHSTVFTEHLVHAPRIRMHMIISILEMGILRLREDRPGKSPS